MEQDCIFCQIIAGNAPAEIVYKTDSLVVFKDINPHAPVHMLIVPNKHIRSVNDLEDGDRGIISEMIFAGKEVAKQQGIDKSGYNLLFNVEKGGGQVIFHIHMHLLGGWKR